jgi:hypothetical protein
MKRFENRALLVLSFLILVSAAASAATVRGRLVHAANQYAAAPGIAVTIYNQYVGRSSPAYSDVNGMYYLYNIPAGTYYLELWIHPGGNPVVYPITVGEPYTDIPQIPMPIWYGRFGKLSRLDGSSWIQEVRLVTHTSARLESVGVPTRPPTIEVVVKQMTGEYSCPSRHLYSLNWTCRKLARSLDFYISHVTRENNIEANSLANSGARKKLK